MQGRFLRLLAMMVLVLLAGCANMKLHNSSATLLLQEYKQVSSWSAAQTEVGVRKREKIYLKSSTVEARLRLALALGFGTGKAVDLKRALRLFDETIRTADEQDAEQVLFAEVLSTVLKSTVQAEAKINSAESKLNSAESKLTAAEAKVGVLSKQLEGERERADALEKKLGALMSIEKSLQKR